MYLCASAPVIETINFGTGHGSWSRFITKSTGCRILGISIFHACLPGSQSSLHRLMESRTVTIFYPRHQTVLAHNSATVASNSNFPFMYLIGAVCSPTPERSFHDGHAYHDTQKFAQEFQTWRLQAAHGLCSSGIAGTCAGKASPYLFPLWTLCGGFWELGCGLRVILKNNP